MDIIKTAAAALDPLEREGITVQQGWYDASLRKTHVTLWKLRDYAAGHSDDDCDVETATIQVNVWSTEDQQDLVQWIRKLMKTAGFVYTEGNDTAEPETGVFMNAMRFFLMEETEEEEE